MRVSRWVDDRLAESPSGALVASVHSRVVNLRLGRGEFLCVAAIELPLAANGVAVDLAAGFSLVTLGLRAGQLAVIGRRTVRVPEVGFEVCVRGAARWEPRPGPHRVSRADLVQRARQVRTLAMAEGHRRSLLPLLWALGDSVECRTADPREVLPVLLRRILRPAAALRAAAASGDPATTTRAAREIAGLGPGLTPSGDDFLAGFAAAWALVPEALGVPVHRADVLDALCDGARGRASDLGGAWLRHATRGEVAEPMARFLGSLLGATSGGLGGAARGILGLGATSGADWMTGTLIGIDAVLAAFPLVTPAVAGHDLST